MSEKSFDNSIITWTLQPTQTGIILNSDWLKSNWCSEMERLECIELPFDIASISASPILLIFSWLKSNSTTSKCSFPVANFNFYHQESRDCHVPSRPLPVMSSGRWNPCSWRQDRCTLQASVERLVCCHTRPLPKILIEHWNMWNMSNKQTLIRHRCFYVVLCCRI